MNTFPEERGVTLIEVVTVATVLALLTVMIGASVINLTTTQKFNEGQARIADIGDRVVRVVQRDVSFSIRLFIDDAGSQSYFDALDFGAVLAPGSVRPIVTSRGFFDRDPPGMVESGNLLFLGLAEPPITADLSGGIGAPDPVRVDTLKFVVYYLTRLPSGALDLGRWSSVVLARYKDIIGVTDPDRRTALLLSLHRSGVRFAWNPDAPTAAAGLFEILSTGWIANLAPGERIPADPAAALTVLLSTLHVHVAENGELEGVAVPAYAAVNGAFPAGLEIKVDGPSSGKLVLLRLVLASGGPRTVKNFAQVLRLASCRG